jgi:hypothetical protein
MPSSTVTIAVTPPFDLHLGLNGHGWVALANDAEALLEASAKTAPPDRLLLKFRSTKAPLAQ